MRIRRPRGVTVTQLMIVTALGFLGGVYIWKPLIVKWRKENILNTDKTANNTSESTD